MTTKEQELKALARIQKIVAELGEDSYVGTAFAGCFEIAESNIENDFACSMQDRAASAQRRASEAEERAERAEAHAKDLQKALDEEHERASKAEGERNGMYNRLKNLQDKIATENEEKVGSLLEANAALDNKAADLQKRLEEKELEVIKLKAKLFDMMMNA